MRAVQIGDILALADALAGKDDPTATALRLCAETHAAHAYAKRFDRLHPSWGNGSLMSRLYAEGGQMQADWSQDGLAALAAAALAIARWRDERLGLSRPAPMC